MNDDAPQGYYAASAGEPAKASSLQQDMVADVCVVGAGYTGLSAALHLALSGVKVVIVEAQTVGFAASGRNGGQIHPGHRKSQAELERWLGRGHAQELWEISEKARELVFELAAENCDVRRGLVIAAHNARSARSLAIETEHLVSRYAYSQARMLDRAQTSAALGTDVYPGARMDMGGGHLHPLRFARLLASKAVAAGASLYENSRVLQIADGPKVFASGQRFKVTADHLILACDAFIASLAPQLAPYLAHVESFIAATEPLGGERADRIIPSNAAVADTRHVLDYYRKSSDDRLLFAGREAYWTPPNDVASIVRPRLLKVFPALHNISLEYGWSGTVGITRTRMPHFGKLHQRILFAHGYSGHGVALATLGGKILADAVLGDKDRFESLARVPALRFPGGPVLRRPMVTAALLTLKLADSF